MTDEKAPSAPKAKVKITPGVGADIGTMNIVSARREKDGIKTKRERDAFVSVPSESGKKMLRLRQRNVIERDDEMFIVGDAAMTVAQMMGIECRRPLKDGLIHAGELDAIDVLAAIIKTVLGEPKVEKEACYFSIPAAPVDAQRDTIYHKGVFDRIITQCGYSATASNEAMAIIYAETAEEDFSGIGISFGAGMCNIALASEGIEGMTFSVARGGDWIDNGVAKAVGMTASNVCALKESGLDLMEVPKGDRPREALALYYKELTDYCLDHIDREFKSRAQNITLPKPIPIVVSGGTSMAEGFLDFFEDVFEKRRKRFPIEISEVRQAKDPLNAVAHGLMTQAILEHED